MADEDLDAPLVYPKVAFARARTAYPTLQEELNKAEWQLGGAEVMLDHHFHRLLPAPFRPAVEGRLLSGRTNLISTLAVERAVSLGEGLAVEIEANRRFAAASIARSLMELVGLLTLLRRKLMELREADPVDRKALDEATMSFLVANRSLSAEKPAVEQPKLVTPSEMINAARDRFGDVFGEDYGYLCDLTHPNASGVFGVELIEESATIAVLRRPPVTEGDAEVLLKILGAGLHSVTSDAMLLIDWAAESDLELTR